MSRPARTGSQTQPKPPAVFLDRDGTIIEDTGYLRDPARVRLLPRAAQAIARINALGYPVVVVTNQSGISRGLLSEGDYHATEQRLDQLLAAEGARIDAHYYCPHLPEITGVCECRKPGTLLYRQAAERFNLDLAGSWWVGDRARDVLPAAAFGGRGILVLGDSDGSEIMDSQAHRVIPVRDLSAAVDRIVQES